MSAPSLPFSITVIAPFNAVPEGPFKLRFLEVDPADPDAALGELGLSLSVSVPHDLSPSGWVDLRITELKDFHPDGLIARNACLKDIADARDAIREGIERGDDAGKIHERLGSWPDLPVKFDYTPPSAAASPAPPPPSSSGSVVDDIMSMVATPGESSSGPAAGPELAAASPGSGDPQNWARDLDRTLSQLLVNIFTNQDFRRFEASWRGFELFTKRGLQGAEGKVNIRICSLGMSALETNLEKLEDALAADPPSLILLDIPFDSTTRSLDLITKMAGLAERMMAPLITAADKRFLNLARWEDLQKLPFLPHYLDDAQFAKWRRLRGQAGGDWLGVLFNGFLVRNAYGRDHRPSRVEFMEGGELFLSPVWAFATLLARQYLKGGWPTAYSFDEGVKLGGLAVAGEERERLATAAYMPGDRPSQFTASGITPLVGLPGEASVAVAPPVTVSGKSLDYQMIFSRLIALVLWCKDNFDMDMGPQETEINLMATFAEFWNATGKEAPADLKITVRETDDGRPYLVTISLSPGREVLPAGGRIEITLNW